MAIPSSLHGTIPSFDELLVDESIALCGLNEHTEVGDDVVWIWTLDFRLISFPFYQLSSITTHSLEIYFAFL